MRDRLVEFFWPGVGDRRGRHSLAQGLTAIRHVLGPHAIVRNGSYVRLDAALTSDLDHPQLPAASSAEPPRPLEDFDHLGSVEFSHWVDAARARILRGVRVALQRHIETLRARGDLHLVHEPAATLYRVDPTNDIAVHVLAEHAVESGDRVGAAALLEEFLDRESPRLTLHQRSSLRRHLVRVRTPERIPPAVVQSSARRCVFVARETETRRLQDRWNSLSERRTQTLLVTGTAGVGKTTLADRFARFLAADGHLVVRATCQPIAREIPFAALASLIEDLSSDPELGATDPHWLGEASRVAPFLASQFAGIPRPSVATGETVRLAVAEAFHQMLETIAATGPVLLVIDDVQHLDPATRDVLTVLARRPRNYPLLTLALFQTTWDRPSGPAHEEAPLGSWDEELHVAPLDVAAGHRLASALCERLEIQGQSREVLDNLVRLSDGVPYFLETLVEDWRVHGEASLAGQTLDGGPALEWEPPPSVRAAFARRHARLDAMTRQVLEAVALAAHRVSVELIAALLSQPKDDVNRAVLTALRDGDLTADMASVSFRNEIHRSYVYHGINRPRRIYLHSRLATLLTSDAVALPADHSVQAAHHFLRAGAVDAAHRWAAAGAEVAMRQGAPREAERILRSVLRGATKTPRDLALLLCEALNVQAKYDESFRLASKTTVHDESGRCRAACLISEAAVRGHLGEAGDISRHVAFAVTVTRQSVCKQFSTRALLLAAEHAADSRDWIALNSVVRAINQEARSHETLDGQSALALAMTCFASGFYVRAHQYVRHAYKAFEEERSYGGQLKALSGSGAIAAATGDFRSAKAAWLRAYRLAIRIGDHSMASNVASNTATLHVEYADYPNAVRWYRCALQSDGAIERNRYRPAIHANMADMSLCLGNRNDAAQSLAHAKRSMHEEGLTQWHNLVSATEADLAIWESRHRDACAIIRQMQNAIRSAPQRELVNPPLGGFDSAHFLRQLLFADLIAGAPASALPSPLHVTDGPMPLASYVELVGFVEWARQRSGESVPSAESTFEALAAATGLRGVLVRLSRLGLTPIGTRGPYRAGPTVRHR